MIYKAKTHNNNKKGASVFKLLIDKYENSRCLPMAAIGQLALLLTFSAQPGLHDTLMESFKIKESRLVDRLLWGEMIEEYDGSNLRTVLAKSGIFEPCASSILISHTSDEGALRTCIEYLRSFVVSSSLALRDFREEA